MVKWIGNFLNTSRISELYNWCFSQKCETFWGSKLLPRKLEISPPNEGHFYCLLDGKNDILMWRRKIYFFKSNSETRLSLGLHKSWLKAHEIVNFHWKFLFHVFAFILVIFFTSFMASTWNPERFFVLLSMRLLLHHHSNAFHLLNIICYQANLINFNFSIKFVLDI